MKICFFTKYPPIEGGTSSRSYWLARALGEKEIEVHIITNSLEGNLWREKINFEDPQDLANFQPKNVYVHSLDETKNYPFRQNYESRLSSLGIEVIERYQCNVIDSFYLLPYGVSAYLAKKITSRPLILRHAGSDIAKIISDRTFHPLFKKIFSEANLVFTLRGREAFFRGLGVSSEKLFSGFSWWVNPKYFNPQVPPIDFKKYGLEVNPELPIITYVGKINPWKGVYELIKAASQINEDFLLLFAANGPESEQYKNYIKRFRCLQGKYYFLGFVPPWQIPALLKRSTCLLQLERDFPVVSHMPIQPLEAMAVGVCPVISEEVYEAYKNFPGLEKEKNILVVDPKNTPKLKNLMEKVIKNQDSIRNIGREASKIFKQNAFENSISAMVKIYDVLAKENKSFKTCLEELRNVIIKYL